MRHLAASLVIVLLASAVTTPAEAGGCRPLRIPAAEYAETTCLRDLTTVGGRTNPADYAGLTHAGLLQPKPVSGVQVDGYFPDTSRTNANNGWDHDAQFVLRLPDRWNGGFVVAGSPGVRAQYANDRAISDDVLGKGYAYAATDKGNTGAEFYRDGVKPGDAMVEWNRRMTELTRAARAAVAKYYARKPREVIAAGISNGGYLVRWQLENHPELYTRGVDLEGTLWTEDGPNLFTFLPPAIRGYEQQNPRLITAAGFDRGSDFLWDYHYAVYWKLTQRIYAAELDPTYAGIEGDYDYTTRPQAHQAVRRIALTGDLKRPLTTIHGTYDSLLPITQDSDVYAAMVRRAGKAHLFRYQRVEAGNHVDGLVDAYPDRLTPLVPLLRKAI